MVWVDSSQIQEDDTPFMIRWLMAHLPGPHGLDATGAV